VLVLFWGALLGVRLRGLRFSCAILVALCCGVMRMREADLTHGFQFHSCAVLSSGAVRCWGVNGYGQVSALACHGVKFLVVCVRDDVCLLTSRFLQVGDGTSGSNRLTSVGVVGLGSNVVNVALGYVRLFAGHAR